MKCHGCKNKIVEEGYFKQVFMDGWRNYWCSWECLEEHIGIPKKGFRGWLIKKLLIKQCFTVDFT